MLNSYYGLVTAEVLAGHEAKIRNCPADVAFIIRMVVSQLPKELEWIYDPDLTETLEVIRDCNYQNTEAFDFFDKIVGCLLVDASEESLPNADAYIMLISQYTQGAIGLTSLKYSRGNATGITKAQMDLVSVKYARYLNTSSGGVVPKRTEMPSPGKRAPEPSTNDIYAPRATVNIKSLIN